MYQPSAPKQYSAVAPHGADLMEYDSLPTDPVTSIFTPVIQASAKLLSISGRAA